MRLSVWGILILTLVGSVNSLPANGHASAAPASVTLTGHPVGDPYYLNFVRLGGIMYLSRRPEDPPAVGRPLQGRDLGTIVAHVRSKLDGMVHDPTYLPKDGDAAYLPVGTPIYGVKGYRPTFRLVARWNGHLFLYEADTNPQARRGADLLDVAGKVRSIGIDSDTGDGTTEIAAIAQPAQVATLVGLLLSARVDQGQTERDATRYFLTLSLLDGTTVHRAFWPASGQLSRGIITPSQFRLAIMQAVRRRS